MGARSIKFAKQVGLEPFYPYKRSLQASFITQLNSTKKVYTEKAEVFMVNVVEPRQIRHYSRMCFGVSFSNLSSAVPSLRPTNFLATTIKESVFVQLSL